MEVNGWLKVVGGIIVAGVVGFGSSYISMLRQGDLSGVELKTLKEDLADLSVGWAKDVNRSDAEHERFRNEIQELERRLDRVEGARRNGGPR